MEPLFSLYFFFQAQIPCIPSFPQASNQIGGSLWHYGSFKISISLMPVSRDTLKFLCGYFPSHSTIIPCKMAAELFGEG